LGVFLFYFLEAFPADRFKLFRRIAFFQDKKRASAGRCFFSGKNAFLFQKAFRFHQG
jgi:hypothetical protein